MMKEILAWGVCGIIIASMTGCAAVGEGYRETTLSATYKEIYEFPLYTLVPPGTNQWQVENIDLITHVVEFVEPDSHARIRYDLLLPLGQDVQRNEDSYVKSAVAALGYIYGFDAASIDMQQKMLHEHEFFSFPISIRSMITGSSKSLNADVYLTVRMLSGYDAALSMAYIRPVGEGGDLADEQFIRTFDSLKMRDSIEKGLIAKVLYSKAAKMFEEGLQRRTTDEGRIQLEKLQSYILSFLDSYGTLFLKEETVFLRKALVSQYGTDWEKYGKDVNQESVAGYYEKAIAANGRNQKVRVNYAAFLDAYGKTEEALAQYKILTDIEPENASYSSVHDSLEKKLEQQKSEAPKEVAGETSIPEEQGVE